MIVIGSFREASPTFKEAADRSGSSYQNVKQLALKLEKHGYVDIVDDPKDARAKRIVMTEKAKVYWLNRKDRDKASMDKLFRMFDNEELAEFYRYIMKMQEGIRNL